MASFERLSTDDRPEGEDNSQNCCDIHFALHPMDQKEECFCVSLRGATQEVRLFESKF
jgi:hypothetical protein